MQGVDGVRGVAWRRKRVSRVSRVSGPGRRARRGAQHGPWGRARAGRGARPGRPSQRRLRSRHLTSAAENGCLELRLEWGVRVSSQNGPDGAPGGKHPFQPTIEEQARDPVHSARSGLRSSAPNPFLRPMEWEIRFQIC